MLALDCPMLPGSDPVTHKLSELYLQWWATPDAQHLRQSIVHQLEADCDDESARLDGSGSPGVGGAASPAAGGETEPLTARHLARITSPPDATATPPLGSPDSPAEAPAKRLCWGRAGPLPTPLLPLLVNNSPSRAAPAFPPPPAEHVYPSRARCADAACCAAAATAGVPCDASAAAADAGAGLGGAHFDAADEPARKRCIDLLRKPSSASAAAGAASSEGGPPLAVARSELLSLAAAAPPFVPASPGMRAPPRLALRSAVNRAGWPSPVAELTAALHTHGLDASSELSETEVMSLVRSLPSAPLPCVAGAAIWAALGGGAGGAGGLGLGAGALGVAGGETGSEADGSLGLSSRSELTAETWSSWRALSPGACVGAAALLRWFEEELCGVDPADWLVPCLRAGARADGRAEGRRAEGISGGGAGGGRAGGSGRAGGCVPDLSRAELLWLAREVVRRHVGLTFLSTSPEFQQRYAETVVARVLFVCDPLGGGSVRAAEARRGGELCRALSALDSAEASAEGGVSGAINAERSFFSYEHFYVLFCAFCKLDEDGDHLLTVEDLARYGGCALSRRAAERVFSCRRLARTGGLFEYDDFVRFVLSEEDRSSRSAMGYWFRVLDIDGDGAVSLRDMAWFYEEQAARMGALGHEPIPFADVAHQLTDALKPACPGRGITLADMRRSRLGGLLVATLTNIHKFLAGEVSDAAAARYARETPHLTDWDRWAHAEYLRLEVEDEEDAEMAVGFEGLAESLAAADDDDDDDESLDADDDVFLDTLQLVESPAALGQTCFGQVCKQRPYTAAGGGGGFGGGFGAARAREAPF